MDGWTLPNMMGESSGFSFMLHLTLSRVCGSAEKGLLCLLLTPALLFGSDHEFIHLKQFHLAWVLFQLVCLVDCRVTWSMQSVPEGGWGRCVEYPGSNSELLDWLTVHLQCISAVYFLYLTGVWSVFMCIWTVPFLHGQLERALQELPAFLAALSHGPRVSETTEGKEGRNALWSNGWGQAYVSGSVCSAAGEACLNMS